MSAAELEMIQEMQQHSSPEKISKPIVTAPAPRAATKTNTKANKGIMGMLANKPPAKTLLSNLDIKLEKKETPSVEAFEPNTATSTAVNKFFGKSTKKQDKSIKEAEPPSQLKSKQSQPPAKPDEEKEKEEQDFKQLKQHKEVRSKTKRPELSDSDEERTRRGSQSKKRRRIKKPQSESSDEEDTSAKPAVATPTSPERQVKVHPEGKRRKRRRVLKSKTFVDDEGCIVTEKVYESESYSESEEMETSWPASQTKVSTLPFPPKKEEGKKSAKKSSAPGNKSTKQASIMGFFQKK